MVATAEHPSSIVVSMVPPTDQEEESVALAEDCLLELFNPFPVRQVVLPVWVFLVLHFEAPDHARRLLAATFGTPIHIFCFVRIVVRC